MPPCPIPHVMIAPMLKGKKRLLGLMTVILFLGAGPGRAYFTRGANTGIGASSPRALGMGGAFVAVSDDSAAVFWNPAGAVLASPGEFSLAYASLFNDKIAQLASSLIVGSGGVALGLAMERMDYGDLLTVDSSGGAFGRVSLYESEYLLAVSAALDGDRRLLVGGALKLYSVDYGSIASASGQGMDVGVLYRFGLGKAGRELRIGASLSDIGSSLESDRGYTQDISSVLRMGLAFYVAEDALISYERATITDESFSSGSTSSNHFGCEVPVVRELLLIRAGYSKSGGSSEGRFSYGGGVRRQGISFDYTFAEGIYNLGDTHRFGCSLRFGSLNILQGFGEEFVMGEFYPVPGKPPDPKRWVLYEIEPSYYYRDLMERNAEAGGKR